VVIATQIGLLGPLTVQIRHTMDAINYSEETVAMPNKSSR